MNDLIQIIKILEPSELEDLNKYINTLKFERNKILRDGSTVVNNDSRTSSGTSLLETHQLTINFHKKINLGLDEYKRRVQNIHSNFSLYPVPGGHYTKSWREDIQILQYEKSQEYKFHHDAATYEHQKEYHRKISVIVYLNDGFKGGGTSFVHKTYKPQPGYALIFPSNWCYPHAGQVVEEGRKRVAVTWYYVDQTQPT